MLDHLLIEMCKTTGVSTKTIFAVIKAESSGNENAFNVNRHDYPKKSGLTREETIEEVSRLIQKGESVDMGLMQINSIHLKSQRLTVEEIFEPCTNIRIGSLILLDAYQKAVTVYGEGQKALQGALSIYNTGHLMKGHSNGYVAKFYGSQKEAINPYTADVSISLKVR